MPVYSLSAQEPEPTVIDRVIEIDKAIEEDPFEGRKRRDLNMIKTRELSARNAGLVQGAKLPAELLSTTKGIDFRSIAKEIIVANEGYREEPYKGADQVWTGGIGATGKGAKELTTPEAIYTRFDKDLEKHIGRAKEDFGSSFEKFHPITQAFIADSYFRGGLAGSRNTRNLMKQGKLKEAAKEFLNHREYRASRDGTSYMSKRKDKEGKTYYVEIWPGPGVARRMERFSDHLKSLPTTKEEKVIEDKELNAWGQWFHGTPEQRAKAKEKREREEEEKAAHIREGRKARQEEDAKYDRGIAGQGQRPRWKNMTFKQGTTTYYYDQYTKTVHPDKTISYEYHKDKKD